MNIITKRVLVVLCSFSLVACASNVGGQKQTLGTLLGAGAGAAAGAQIGKGRGRTAAMIGLGLLGAMIGGNVGAQLDQRDRDEMAKTTQKTLETAPSNTPVAWNNPDSKVTGTVIAQPAVQQSNGQYCREFTQTVVIGGQNEQAHGNACRQPDGTWAITQETQLAAVN